MMVLSQKVTRMMHSSKAWHNLPKHVPPQHKLSLNPLLSASISCQSFTTWEQKYNIHILEPSVPAHEVKAVVLMWGWLGSRRKHVEKYAQLYANRNCTVVYGIAPLLSLLVIHLPTFQAFAKESVSQVCTITRKLQDAKQMRKEETDRCDIGSYPSTRGAKEEKLELHSRVEKPIPIIMHSFSNGGAFITATLASMLEELNKSKKPMNEENVDLKFFSQRMLDNGFEVFDSAPAYLYPDTFYHVIDAVLPEGLNRLAAKSLMTTMQTLAEISDYINQRDSFPVRFWNNMVQKDVCQRKVYLYSTKDALTDSFKIEELIELKKSQGVEVISYNFNKSNHVQHWRRYPMEYERMLDEILSRV